MGLQNNKLALVPNLKIGNQPKTEDFNRNEHLQKLEALSIDPSLKVSPEKRSVVVENIRHHLMPVRLETFFRDKFKTGG